MLKNELRRIFTEKQKSITPSERASLSRRIGDRLFNGFNFTSMSFFHVFISLEKTNEIQTSFIINRLWEKQKKLCVPCVDFETMTMEAREYHQDSILVANKWQILEPLKEKKAEAEKIDVVLTPLLCFDQRGYRVGYGKGFYDRFLSECRQDCLKIGLSFFEAVDEISDTNKFDVTLDFCVTPSKVWKF